MNSQIGASLRRISKTPLSTISRVPRTRADLSHGYTEKRFHALLTLHSALSSGLDTPLCLLPKHPATWKLYLSCNIFVEEIRIIPSSVGYWDRK